MCSTLLDARQVIATTMLSASDPFRPMKRHHLPGPIGSNLTKVIRPDGRNKSSQIGPSLLTWFNKRISKQKANNASKELMLGDQGKPCAVQPMREHSAHGKQRLHEYYLDHSSNTIKKMIGVPAVKAISIRCADRLSRRSPVAPLGTFCAPVLTQQTI